MAGKILFCSLHPLDRKLGASKVILEAADELTRLGWTCELASDKEICPGIDSRKPDEKVFLFKDDLQKYLLKRAREFDVVDYDHICLPFSRNQFTPTTLFVARSVLLVHHFEKIKLPHFSGVRPFLGRVLKGYGRGRTLKQTIKLSDLTLKEADLINVSNTDDRQELVSRGIDEKKIVVIPYGLSTERFAQFEKARRESEQLSVRVPTIAFVGTFDVRKGGTDLPKIVEILKEAIPHVRVKLLGARYRDGVEVLSYFPENLRSHIDVISNYDPTELPRLLANCTVGIFPSYIEGFGFAVLEMMASGLPVIAYDAPGPDMILSKDYLVPRGDVKAMGEKILKLLTHPQDYEVAKKWTLSKVEEFRWEVFGQQTSEIYLKRLNQLRASHQA